jgi:hypothetical protein
MAVVILASPKTWGQSANARFVVISSEVFSELADQVEQQLPASLAERQVSQFIDDDKIVAQKIIGETSAASGGLLLFKLVDQIDEIEEAAPGAGSDDWKAIGISHPAAGWQGAARLPRGFDRASFRGRLEVGGMTLGDRIRTTREVLGLSQAELAKRVNTTKATISRWEAGERAIST